MAIKLFCFVWLSLFLPFIAFNTTGVGESDGTRTLLLEGVVLDEETRRPVAYANVVLVKGKKNTQTNADGKFRIQLTTTPSQETLKILSLGYTTKTLPVADLLKDKSRPGKLTVYLKPKLESLEAVEISARSRRWKVRKVGYNIGKGTRFHHQFSPLDTVVEKIGQEISNNFKLKKYPAHLQSISFGLAGSGNVKALVGLRIYSLKQGRPDKPLSERVILRIPPHHTGWITTDLRKYNITLKDDFAVAIEWLSETNKLNKSSLLAFAKHPEGQITYYRSSPLDPWKLQKPTLTSINSIGLYVSVLY